MNLIFEEQANNVIFGEIFNYDDFEDQMRCVAQDENRKNEQFIVIKGT